MESAESIVIVFAIDDGYAMQLSAALYSVLKNTEFHHRLIFYVMDGGIKDATKHKILKSLVSYKDRLKVEWLKIPDEIYRKELKSSGHVSIATYFRLLIPNLLPQHYTKAIYLDSDLIVNQDICRLWEAEIGDNYLLAAQDTAIPYVSSPNGLINYKELNIPREYKYFNAGVLVLNLKKWRSEGIAERVIDYLEKNKDFVRWWDQDGLNAVLAGGWGELDLRWNQTPGIYDYLSWEDSPFSEIDYNNLISDPYIIHFAKAAKPWNSREFHPANELFFRYVDTTEWKGWRFSIRRRMQRALSREFKQMKRRFQSTISRVG